MVDGNLYDRYMKQVALGMLLLVCVLLAFYVNVYGRIDIVYTHFFYIPIVISAIWYHRKAVFAAVFLGLVHVIASYFARGIIEPAVLIRMGAFIIVSISVGVVSERRHDIQRRLINIINFLPDATFAIDLEGKVMAWNRAIEEMTGVKAEDMLGKGDYEYAIPFYGTRRPILVDLVLNPDEEIEKKYSFVNRGRACLVAEADVSVIDGKDLTVWVKAAPIYDYKNNVVGTIESIRDITKIKQYEANYRSVFENTGTAMAILEEDKTFAMVNTEFERLSGYSKEEIEGKMSWTKLIAKEDLKKMEKYHAERRKNGGKAPTEYEFRLVDKQGNMKEILLKIDVIPGGKRSIASLVDITSLKRIQQALHDEKENFRILVDKSPLGISLIRGDGHYEYINPRFVELFGYTLEDIPAGREWFHKAFPDPEYREKAVSTWIQDNKDAEPGRAFYRELNVRCKNGSEKAIHFRSVGMEGGQTLVIYEDVTEKKRLEEQFQQAQKMEAIGTLAGGIAHDFNNLLMGIQGNAALMLLDIRPDHPHCERLKNVEQYVRKGANLTKQLLGFARGGKYEIRTTDLNEIVEKSSTMFGQTRKEISIHEKYQKDIWAVEVDQGQIEQVLLNIYVNAWQAMPGGGDLYLETENVIFGEDYVKPFAVEPGRYVKVSVTDTGAGMDKATQERIFEPFFTTKEMGTGTGLGLASAYGIIKNHGGYINVYSEEGRGTTFNIYLPVSKAVVRDQGAGAREEQVLRGDETILLVDDEDMILDVGKEMLKRFGYTVLLAGSGKEAVEVYKTNKDEIDLIILDMVMPDMQGIDACELIREINPDIMVLFSSGYGFNGQSAEILKTGRGGFIQKPFDMNELSRKIREILDETSHTTE